MQEKEKGRYLKIEVAGGGGSKGTTLDESANGWVHGLKDSTFLKQLVYEVAGDSPFKLFATFTRGECNGANMRSREAHPDPAIGDNVLDERLVVKISLTSNYLQRMVWTWKGREHLLLTEGEGDHGLFVDALTRGSIQGFFWHDASHLVNGDCLTLVLTYSGGKDVQEALGAW